MEAKGLDLNAGNAFRQEGNRRGLTDRFGRTMTALRLSVTDRCDLRCRYCLPEKGVTTRARGEILSFGEIVRISRVLADSGIRRIRITGGEPLLRRDLPILIRRLSKIPGIIDLSLTSNGTRLSGMAGELRSAGLNRITISLDTLDSRVYRGLTRGGELQSVLDGIQKCREAGFSLIKINTVVLRGINEEELPRLVEFAFSIGAVPRFLEVMPLGMMGMENRERFVPASEILSLLKKRFKLNGGKRPDGSTAREFPVEGSGSSLEVISPVSDRFCLTCNRLRLTARGKLQLCLSQEDGVDLKKTLREGGSDREIREMISEGVRRKPAGNRFLENPEPVYQITMARIGG